MNFSHKCHFHPSQPITKFCPDKKCTLPLCEQCEAIHLQEHTAQYQQPKLIRFNEAYLTATTQIEDFLATQRKTIRQHENTLEEDRLAVIKFIDNYYFTASRSIEDAKGKYHQIEEKLNKLKKGSIKTLIFYFSGDIELVEQPIKFETLIERLRVKNIKEDVPPVYPHANKPVEMVNQGLVKDVAKLRSTSVPKSSNLPFDQDIFSSIEEIKLGDRSREKTRKSIFEITKKTPQEEMQPRQQSTKYNYNVTSIVENEEERDRQPAKYAYPQRKVAEPEYKGLERSWEKVQERDKSNDRSKDRSREKVQERDKSNDRSKDRSREKEQEPPVSFQNRQTNKFTGSEQYESYKKQKDERMLREQARQQSQPPQQKQNNQKILRSSDLDLHHQSTEQPLSRVSTNSPNLTIANQRIRSQSHTVLVNNQVRAKPQEHGYDLTKQVLAPEEIRRMLEKRMDERNRILSIKKAQNYGPSAVEGARKGWETKDSIINQIYVDQKH